MGDKMIPLGKAVCGLEGEPRTKAEARPIFVKPHRDAIRRSHIDDLIG